MTATLAEPPRSASPAVPADLLDRLGGIPADRVRLDPPPGTATWEDVGRVRRETDRLCELIDGVLVEKIGTDWHSYLTGELTACISNWAHGRTAGYVLGPNGYYHFGDDLRAPDVSFTPRQRRPGGLLRRGYSDVPPSLVVEVFSPGNTRREMELKRGVYFGAGVERVWEVGEEEVGEEEVRVYADPETFTTLRCGDTLTGDPVLPGFAVTLDDLFADPLA